MIEHLWNIVVMALAALGVWTAMGEGMILERLRWLIEGKNLKTLKSYFPLWLQKMLAICPRCMVTIYGTAALLLLGWQFNIYVWPVYLLSAVGLQEMLHR